MVSTRLSTEEGRKEAARQHGADTPDTAWSTEAPYRKPDKNFEKNILGSCHCELVQYWLSREVPLTTKFCHCEDCQIIHGKMLSLYSPGLFSFPGERI